MVLLVAGAWLATLASPAVRSFAAVGALSYNGCLNNDGTQGCVDLPQSPLQFPAGVAVSPNGRSVYVIAGISSSIGHFFAGAQGQLSWDGCLSNDGIEGCGDLPGSVPLPNPFGVAVSPDGTSVYVVGGVFTASITHLLATGPQGQLSWGGCLNNDATDSCGDLPAAPITFPTGVAVSPSNTSVYVASGASTAHFFTGPQGQLTWDGCLNDDGTENCGDLPAAPLPGGPDTVAVSPDGKSVYVADSIGNSIAHFFATGPEGQLTWGGCLNNDGTQGCADLPAAPLTRAIDVAVSPDGKSVYVVSLGSNSIAHFLVTGPQGQLSWGGCLSNDGSQNCGAIPADPLTGPWSVAVSPDSRSVYVVSRDAASIAHFATGPQGQLTWDGCLNNDGTQDCGDLPAQPLSEPSGVAVSPDGKSVYVVSASSNSIAHFFREAQTPVTTSTVTSTTTSTTTTTTPTTTTTTTTTTTAQPDSRPPSAPRQLRGRFADGTLTLNWRAASDNVGVDRYDLYRDGARVRRLPGTASRTSLGGFRTAKRTTFTLRALDAARNRSAASNRLTATPRKRPTGVPRTIPRWARKLLTWEVKGKRGRRPGTPTPLPSWYRPWKAWKLNPYTIA